MHTALTSVLIGTLCLSATAGDAFEITTPGKPGTAGLVPALSGIGSGLPGSANVVALDDALPLTSTTLVLGLSELAAPFKGGVLGPNPDLLIGGIVTDAAGGWEFPLVVPTDLVSLELWMQTWVADAGASQGLSASNGLRFRVTAGASPFTRAWDDVSGSALELLASDFDDDGHADALSVYPSGADVLLGNGAGDLVAGPTFVASGPVVDAAAGDVDGDGWYDVVLIKASGFASTRPGKGDGTFQASVNSFVVGDPIRDATLADLNADGHLDLVTVHAPGPVAGVALGAGDGSFAAPVFAPAATGNAPRVAAADMNADGHLDVVLGTTSGAHLLLGAGDGTLAAPVSLGGAGGRDLALDDIDADGEHDIALLRASPDQVIILQNLGAAAAFTSHVVPAGGGDPRALEVADVDGDGHLDLVTGIGATQTVTIRSGTGDLTAFGGLVSVETGGAPGLLAVSDLDGGVGVDLLAVDDVGDRLCRILAGGALPGVANLSESWDDRVVLHDHDGDGLVDRVVFDPNTADVRVALRQADGSYGPPTALVLSHAIGASLTFADVTGDGIADLLTGRISVVSVFPGLGAGAYGTAVSWPAGVQNRTPRVTDLNADGVADLALTANNGAPLWDDSLVVLLGTGGGAFAPPVAYGIGTDPGGLELLDMDGDGDLDVLLPMFWCCGFVSLVNDGSGALTQVPSGAPTFMNLSYASASADFDCDGLVDVAVTYQDLPFFEVRIFRGAGDGSFTQVQTISLDTLVAGLDVGDVDLDGVPDLVVGSDGARWLRGLGDGSFDSPEILSLGTFFPDVQLVDLDSDGDLDVHVSALSGGSFDSTELLNQLVP